MKRKLMVCLFVAAVAAWSGCKKSEPAAQQAVDRPTEEVATVADAATDEATSSSETIMVSLSVPNMT